jgi:hypothetical protein
VRTMISPAASVVAPVAAKLKARPPSALLSRVDRSCAHDSFMSVYVERRWGAGGPHVAACRAARLWRFIPATRHSGAAEGGTRNPDFLQKALDSGFGAAHRLGMMG